MNKTQLQAARFVTNRVEHANRMRSGDPMNGVITWRQLDWGDNVVVLDGSNVNDEKKWFETHIHVIAEIGPRGGVKLRHCEGIRITVLK